MSVLFVIGSQKSVISCGQVRQQDTGNDSNCDGDVSKMPEETQRPEIWSLPEL